ncbi:flagellar protein FlgN [Halocella sp. SP3-1]|uniref:flagellar protein FlgN n=1 Tax=Halocella sp. SP3-1 TaxID=2382161 RepID=UPI000F765246|nr:flagellar protein FlgN [Halocella sp. SP3-1]AZO93998.1 flagellar protein FlgN [Halocella sp. SP3-1]
MTVDAKKICEILKTEYQLYQSIYQLARRKQDIIIAEDLEGLEEIVKKEEKLLGEVQKMEEARLELVDTNLDDLLSRVDKPNKQELDDLRNRLVSLTLKLKEQNLLNNQLIEDSLTLVNIKLNLAKNNGGTKTYSKKGLVKKSGSTFVNRRA